MTVERMLEFSILTHLEDKYNEDDDFSIYMDSHCNLDKFNKRYGELLDEFLTQYALNKTEKSD